MAESRLQVRGLSKLFPGVRALDAVDFDVQTGEVHALVGENGAGKSTLIKILSGVHLPSAGQILLDASPVSISSPEQAQLMGISPVHQEVHLVPLLSVAENILLGRQPKGRFGLIDHRRMREIAGGYLAELGMPIDPAETLAQLTVAKQQMVSIARALSVNARILILDEPTASMSDREAKLLFDIIRRLRARGLSVIYISHRLEEVFAVADRVTVLRDGRAVGSHAVGDITLNQVIQLMVGRELSDLFRKEEVAIGPPVLEVKQLNVRGVLHDISFTLHRGEILGVAGLVGAGRTELARALFGADRRDSGEVLLDGKPMNARSPGEAIAHGLGLAPEDRKQHGLIMGMSVAHNMTLANLFRRQRLGFINLRRERDTAQDYVRRLGIRTPDVQRDVKFLSGGNQQRVVIAKWLETRPRVLILDEPTQGVDVGAKAEIHALMVDLARSGVGILMISSDLPEVLQMSDRLLVMHQGRITGCLGREEASQEQVMRYATDTVLQTAAPLPTPTVRADLAT